ncbi:unnamed protein product, partial [Staurois parvus]
MLLPGPQCLMGPCTAPHCCCLHRTLCLCHFQVYLTNVVGFHFVIGCWSLVRPPIAAARPRNLPWASVPPPHAAARSRVSLGPVVTASHCCCLHRHTLPCATFR